MYNKPYSSQDVLNGAYDETKKAIRIIGGGGGSGGTTDYSLLTNKPKINSIDLSGNLSAADLGLVDSSQLESLSNRLSDVEAAIGTFETQAEEIIGEGNEE